MGRIASSTHWQGTVTSTPLCGGQVAPPASMTLLFSARDVVEAVWQAYAQPALCCEGNTTGLEVRRFGLVIGPASVHGRMTMTRCPLPTSSSNHPSVITGATDGVGIPVKYLFDGDEVYLQAGLTVSTGADMQEGSGINDGSASDRALKLPTHRHASIEQVEVTYSAGCGLSVFDRGLDLETLA